MLKYGSIYTVTFPKTFGFLASFIHYYCFDALQEVDISGPFQLSSVRAGVADYTVTIFTGNTRIVGGLGGLSVDPWSFLLPLTPVVWAATLTALLAVFVVLQILPFCLANTVLDHGGWSVSDAFSCVRIILQQGKDSGIALSCMIFCHVFKVSVLQERSCRESMKTATRTPNTDIVLPSKWWWWERLVLGLWMLATLVLIRSYAGNLMSLLAVRYVPQPFQTPSDILDDPHVSIILQKYSKNEQFFRVNTPH